MTLNIDTKSPTSDEINAIVQEAHKLRAQAFSHALRMIGNGIKSAFAPKRNSPAAKITTA